MNKNYIKFLIIPAIILCGKTLNNNICYSMEDLPDKCDDKALDNGNDINTSGKDSQSTILDNNINKIDLQNNKLLDETNKKTDNILHLLNELKAPYYIEMYNATRLGNLKNVYTNFSNAINKFIKYINNSPECNIFIKKEEYKQYFNNNIINNNEIMDVIELCQLLVTNTIEKSKAIADNISIEIKTKSHQDLMCADYLQKYITKQLNLFNNDFSKIIQCLEQCISPKIKDVDVTAFNELNSLLTPVISEFYKLEARVHISNFLNEYNGYYCNNELLNDFINLKGKNFSRQDKKIFEYWQERLSEIFLCSRNFVDLLDILCYDIELGKSYEDINEIEKELENGNITQKTAKQMIEETNKAYKDAQQITVKLDKIKDQLTDGDNVMHLHLPYEEDVIELPQLLRNFAIIIANHIRLVHENINEITNKYKNIKPEDLKEFEKEIIYNFALLACSLKIIKNYSFGTLYSVIYGRHPNVCEKIINKEMGKAFKCTEPIKD